MLVKRLESPFEPLNQRGWAVPLRCSSCYNLWLQHRLCECGILARMLLDAVPVTTQQTETEPFPRGKLALSSQCKELDMDNNRLSTLCWRLNSFVCNHCLCLFICLFAYILSVLALIPAGCLTNYKPRLITSGRTSRLCAWLSSTRSARCPSWVAHPWSRCV
jgi:hypothetical protein